MNKGIKTSLIVFIVSVFVILAGFFLLDFKCDTVNILSLCFLEFSLLVSMFSTILLLKRKNGKDTLFYNAGIGSVTAIYQISIIISILLTRGFENNIKGFLFLEITINALMFILCAIIMTVSSYISRSNEKVLEKQCNGEYNKPKRGGF